MLHVTLAWSGYLASLCITHVNAVPSFDINLDEAPEVRWMGVASYYKPEIINLLEKIIPPVDIDTQDQATGQDAWVDKVVFDPEYEAELQGFVTAINHPSVDVKRLKWLNMLYEMDSPYTAGCSDVLWAMPNGRVMHGRNLDDFSEDAKMVDWPAITFDATLHRNGIPLLKMTNWPGTIGVHTGMRFASGGMGGYAVAQNTRSPNDWQENLAAAGRGGKIFGLVVRRVMEEVSDYDTAVNLIYGASYMAPQYFAISGSGPFEGSVLTIDRLAQHSLNSPPIQRLGNSTEDWYLVQTNDDILSDTQDPRRPMANYLLQGSTRDISFSEENMMQFMHTTYLFNTGTLFSSVMVPATGYYKTVLPDEAPEVIDGSSVDKNYLMAGPVTPQAYSLIQESPRQQPHQRKRSFLSRHKHSLAVSKQALAPSDKHVAPADEVSFMQSSVRLET